MGKSLSLTSYQLFIVGLYVALLPLLFIFAQEYLQYDYSFVDLPEIASVVIFTFLVFYLLNKIFHFRKLAWQRLSLFKIIQLLIYSLVVAIPEEIIFRGIIQGNLQNYISNVFILVILSSTIFGMAHLPNDRKGWHPKKLNWEFMGLAFLVGLPLGALFSITNSLLLPTILHAFLLVFLGLFCQKTDNSGN